MTISSVKGCKVQKNGWLWKNQTFYAVHVRRINYHLFGQPQLPFFRLFSQDVVLEGLLALDLSRGGYFKTLRSPGISLHFGHSKQLKLGLQIKGM
jgi:hypothetical protein